MFPSITRRAAVVLGTTTAAAALAIGLAASAGASVNSGIVYTSATPGVAGIYVAPNATRTANGDKMTGVRATQYLRASAENNSGAGGQANMGVELCNATSLTTATSSVILYATWDTTTKLYDIYFGHSLSSSCLGADGGQSNAGTKIASVPAQTTLFLGLTVGKHGVITYTYSDLTTNQGAQAAFGGFTLFGYNRAGVGTNAQATTLTTPATNLLTSFTNVAFRDGNNNHSNGWAAPQKPGLTRDVIQIVDASTNGGSGGVVVNTVLSGVAGVKLYEGQTSN